MQKQRILRLYLGIIWSEDRLSEQSFISQNKHIYIYTYSVIASFARHLHI